MRREAMPAAGQSETALIARHTIAKITRTPSTTSIILGFHHCAPTRFIRLCTAKRIPNHPVVAGFAIEILPKTS
jgi:hypothetical protein